MTGVCGIEVDLFKGPRDLLLLLRGAQVGALQTEEVVQVLGAGEFVVEHGLVAHVSDAPAQKGRWLTEEEDLAVSGVARARRAA